MAPVRQPGLGHLRRGAGSVLQPVERRWTLIGAAAAAAGFTALNLALHNVGHLALGLLFSTLLAAAAFTSNRLIVAVGCVLVALGPWNFLFLAGGPFYIFAIVLLFRARREQEAAGPDEGAEDDDEAESTPELEAMTARSKPHPRSKKKKPRKRW